MLEASSARNEFLAIFEKWLDKFENKYSKTIKEIEELIHQTNRDNKNQDCVYIYNDDDIDYRPDVDDLMRYLKYFGYSVLCLPEEDKKDKYSHQHLLISWKKN